MGYSVSRSKYYNKYYQENKEKMRKWGRDYYQKNTEKVIKLRAKRAKEKKEKFLINLMIVMNDSESLFREFKRGENNGR